MAIQVVIHREYHIFLNFLLYTMPQKMTKQPMPETSSLKETETVSSDTSTYLTDPITYEKSGISTLLFTQMVVSSVHSVTHLFNLGKSVSQITLGNMSAVQLVQNGKINGIKRGSSRKPRSMHWKFFGPRCEPVPKTVVSPPQIQATALPPQISPPRTPQVGPLPTPPS